MQSVRSSPHQIKKLRSGDKFLPWVSGCGVIMSTLLEASPELTLLLLYFSLLYATSESCPRNSAMSLGEFKLIPSTFMSLNSAIVILTHASL